jgi:thioredoxin 1
MMGTTTRASGAGALLLMLLAAPLTAAERSSFDAARFAMAKASDRPIIVHVISEACSVCKAQRAVLDGLAEDPANEALVVLEVDADTQRDALRTLWALSRSTVIAYKGEREVGRSVGDTSPDSLKALVARAVND